MSDDTPPSFQPLGSLVEARQVPDGVVILEGDYGGQIYVVAPASRVECSEGELLHLLRDLDEIAWPGSEEDASVLRYERLPVGSKVPGGMGGARVDGDVWIHKELLPHAEAIRDVLAGRREVIGPISP
jgi:hypothetical protein